MSLRACFAVLFALFSLATLKTAHADVPSSGILITGICAINQVRLTATGEAPLTQDGNVMRTLDARAIYAQAPGRTSGLRKLEEKCLEYKTDVQTFFSSQVGNVANRAAGFVYPQEIKASLYDVQYVTVRDAKRAVESSVVSSEEQRALTNLRYVSRRYRQANAMTSLSIDLTEISSRAIQTLESERVMKRTFSKLRPVAVAVASAALWRWRGTGHPGMGTGMNRIMAMSFLSGLYGTSYGDSAAYGALGMIFSIPLAGAYGDSMDIGVVNGNAVTDAARMSLWGTFAALPLSMAVIHKYGLPWQSDRVRAAKSRKGLIATTLAGLLMGPAYALAWQLQEDPNSDRLRGMGTTTATELGEVLYGLSLGIAMQIAFGENDNIDRTDYRQLTFELGQRYERYHGTGRL